MNQIDKHKVVMTCLLFFFLFEFSMLAVSRETDAQALAHVAGFAFFSLALSVSLLLAILATDEEDKQGLLALLLFLLFQGVVLSFAFEMGQTGDFFFKGEVLGMLGVLLAATATQWVFNLGAWRKKMSKRPGQVGK